jgi:predicted dehydrogenase
MTAIPIKIGIAGYGIVGKRRRFFIDNIPEMQLVAVCDQVFEEDGVFDDGVLFFRAYHSLLNADIDALVVCMPNNIAPVVVQEGLQNGLHVFCEKPPGCNAEDVRQTIVIESKFPKLKLMYGFNHRYHDSVQDALKIIESRELGKLINLRGVYGKSKIVTFDQTNWRTKRSEAGGGVLLDQGIHMVDLMRLFAGEFKDVHSFISNNYWGFDVEDNAYALMRTETGVVAMLNSSATQWRHQFQLDINLEKGSISLSGILSSSKSYGAEKLAVTYANLEIDNGDPREVVTRYNFDPSWKFEMEEFSSCVLNNRQVEQSSSEEALKTMELVERIYNADETWSNR